MSSFDKNFKDSKPSKPKGFTKAPIKKKKVLIDDITPLIKLDPNNKPKKKLPKRFFNDDEDEIEFRIR